MTIKLKSVNEHIAQCSEKLGVSLITGYPGVPATEIVSTAMKLDNVNSEWATNEKAALETCIGVSFNGKRSLCAMKDLGLNYASDVFFGMRSFKINGGLVILTCDDSGRTEGDDMNDSRMYAIMADIPLYEISSINKAENILSEAFKISEKFNVPVQVRTTALVTHQHSFVELEKFEYIEHKVAIQNKYAANTIQSNLFVLSDLSQEFIKMRNVFYSDYKQRFKNIQEYYEYNEFNQYDLKDSEIVFISSGVCQKYAYEAFPNQSHIEVDCVYPLCFPEKIINKIKEYKYVIIVEESKYILEEQVKKLGIECYGSDIFHRTTLPFYQSKDKIVECIKLLLNNKKCSSKKLLNDKEGIFPILCPSCSHGRLFDAFERTNSKIFVDSGCYAINMYPPYSRVDSFLVMGSAIAMAQGYTSTLNIKVDSNFTKPIAVIGDGVFYHSGIAPLLNAKSKDSNICVVVADNSCIAMTGRQRFSTNKLSIYSIIKNLKIDDVVVIEDSIDLTKLESAISRAMEHVGLSVIVYKSNCTKSKDYVKKEALYINNKCVKCFECTKTKCAAISKDHYNSNLIIDENLCVGCGYCQTFCKYNAIFQKEV